MKDDSSSFRIFGSRAKADGRSMTVWAMRAVFFRIQVFPVMAMVSRYRITHVLLLV